MVYGADAVLPAEVRHNAPRVAAYNEADSNKAMEDAVDLLDEARDTTLARMAVYQQGLCNYHARRVCSRTFNVGGERGRVPDGVDEYVVDWVERAVAVTGDEEAAR